MPPRRKGTTVTREQRSDDNASKVEDSHGIVTFAMMVKQNRRKRDADKDINRLGTEGLDVCIQGEERKHGKIATGRRQVSSKRRSNVPDLGQSTTVLPMQIPNSTLKAAQSSLKVDSLSAHVDRTQTSTMSEPKLDQTLNLRTSTRTRKVVCYNEQSPSNPTDKISSTASKPKAKAAAKRNVSSGAKRVKEDPASSMVETLAPAPETTSHVKRGRTRFLQSHVDKDSAVFAPAATFHSKRGRRKYQGLKLPRSHVDDNSAGGMTSEQTLLLQTTGTKPPQEQNPEAASKFEALEGEKSVKATNKKKKRENAITKNAKVQSDDTVHKQRKKRFSKNKTGAPQEQQVIDESVGLESWPMAAAQGNAQDLPMCEEVDEKAIQVHRLIDGSKKKITVKEIKHHSKKIAIANAAQDIEVCLSDAFDVESKNVCDNAQSTDADKRVCSEALKKARKTVSPKGPSPGAQVDKEGNAHAGIVVDHYLLLDCKPAERGGFQTSTIVVRNPQSQKQGKRRKIVTRMGNYFGTEGDEIENAIVMERAEIKASHDVKLDLKSLTNGGVQKSTNGDKNLQCQTSEKRKKTVTRKRILAATREDEMVNATVLEMPSELAKNDYGTFTDAKPEEVSGDYVPSIGDNKCHVETQQKKKKAVSRKRTLQGAFGNQEQKLDTPLVHVASILQIRNIDDSTAMDGTAQSRGRSTTKRTMLVGHTQRAKKLKTTGSVCSDTQPLASPKPSMQKVVQDAENAEDQANNKAILGVHTQDWTATDLTNFGSKVEGSSERKRKEAGKRKRAMKFDALPVGFGLGISCWSPSPLKCHGLELQEVNGLSEVGDLVTNNQGHVIYSLGDSEKQPYLEEVAKQEDTSNIRLSNIKSQPINACVISSLVTELQESSIPPNDAKRIWGVGLGCTPDKSVEFCGKVKAKMQAGGRTKKTNALLAASPQMVANDNLLDGKKLESGINGLKTKMQPSSRKREPTHTQRITRSRKR